MGPRALRGWGAIAASISVCLLAGVVASAARAGTIWVTDAGGDCSALSFYGNAGVLYCPVELPDVDSARTP